MGHNIKVYFCHLYRLTENNSNRPLCAVSPLTLETCLGGAEELLTSFLACL